MGLNLTGTISLDGAGFERGLHRAGEHVTDFVKNAAVAAFGFYGVEQAIHHTVETASELVNESKRLDLTVEQLQLIRQAAKDAGTDMGTVATAIEKVNLARGKALKGDKGALAAFAKLGVSNDQLKNQTGAGIFMGAMSNTVKNGSVEDLGPALKEILGKGFGQVIPLLKTDFEDLQSTMEALGSIMDTDTAVKLKSLGDRFDLLSNIVSAQLAPVLLMLVDLLTDFYGKLGAIGTGLGELLGGEGGKGFIKGAASLGKETVDSLIDKIPGKLGEALQDASDKYYKKVFDITPQEATARVMDAGAAYSEADDDFKERIAKARKLLDEEAERMRHPPANNNDDTPTPEAAKVKATPSAATDSLIKVGNFLGATGNVISRVDQRKIELHEQTNGKLSAIGIIIQQVAETNARIAVATEKASFGTGGIGVPP